jgi:hypothetical protein
MTEQSTAGSLTGRLGTAYRAMGFGAHRTVLQLFGQDGTDRRDTGWEVVDRIGGSRYASRRVVAEDLFGGIPSTWEVTRVETASIKESGDRAVVTGHIFCRPSGSWDQMAIPFAHIWTFLRGDVVRVVMYLEGVELRRIERLGAGA